VTAFFALPLLFALVFGRIFCAAVCPLGAVQDLVGLRPLKVPAAVEHALGLLAWVYLGLALLLAATGSGYVICRYDPFVAIFRISGEWKMLVLGGCALVIGVFIARPYCRYLCPYGAILRLCSSVSWRHASITPDECVQCRLCADSCPYAAIRTPTATEATGPRLRGKWLLAVLLVAAPVVIAAGGVGGWALGPALSQMNPTVHLALRVRWEEANRQDPETGAVPLGEMTAASEAFREGDRTPRQLYIDALEVKKRFVTGATLIGLLVGLVIALKLLRLSLHRGRKDYEPDRATCLSCGRCFAYCPLEHKRRGQIAGIDGGDER